MKHTHQVDWHAERVGGDLGHYRFETLPDRRRADIHRHAAVGLQFEPRRLLRPGAGTLYKAGDRDAVIAPVNQSALQFALLLPTELSQATFERLTVIAAVAFGIHRRAAGLQPGQLV